MSDYIDLSRVDNDIKLKVVPNEDGTSSLSITGTIITSGSGTTEISTALPAGSNIIGSTKDAGPYWTDILAYTTSGNMTTAVALTASPTAGQKITITDVIVSSAVDTLFDLEEETSATVISAIKLSAGSPVQITPRGKMKLPTSDRKLYGKSSAVGDIYITVIYHSEV